MQNYRIESPVAGSVSLSGYGMVDYDYSAGTVTAADDKEAAVLAHLAGVGLAKPAAEPTKAKASKIAVDEAAPTTAKE